MRSFVLFTVSLLFLAITACAENGPSENPVDNGVTDTTQPDLNDTAVPDTDALTAEWQANYKAADEQAGAADANLIAANNRFALTIFQALNAAAPDKNLVISPFSISTAMAMAVNGASGDNLTEMLDVLEWNGMTVDALDTAYLTLLKSLEKADKDVTLATANSVWIAPVYYDQVSDEFLAALTTYFLSGTYEATDPATINQWVADRTNNKITNLIDQFPDQLIMYLINVLYFKAAWTTAFDPEKTYAGKFTIADGTQKDVQMMALDEQAEYNAYVDKGMVGIRLPYGRGKLAFYAFAPDVSDYPSEEPSDADTFIASLNADSFIALADQYKKHELSGIYLPRFKTSYKQKLNDIFQSLGMTQAFLGGGFSAMMKADSGAEPAISEIVHETYIEVNEAGTEAAAATSVGIVDTAATSPFLANKPFFFFIRDDRTGAILFMGKIADPTVEK